MSNRLPLVSVVIPCYNSKLFLEDAIRSVYNQTYTTIELIVIDDGSTDGSFDFLLDLKQKLFDGMLVLQHPGRANLGVSSSRQLGVRHARGEYIAFLDADDCFEITKIDKQVLFLELNPDVVMCHTGISVIGEQIDAERYVSHFCRHGESPYDLAQQAEHLKVNKICNSSVMVRASVINKLNFSYPQAFQFEDWVSWCLLSPFGKFAHLEEALTIYRLHPGSASTSLIGNQMRRLYAFVEFYLVIIRKSRSLRDRLLSTYLLCLTFIRLFKSYEKKTHG